MFCTGYGQFETHGLFNSKGAANTKPYAGEPYDTITWDEIVEMSINPPTTDKGDAQWFIPSTYHEYDARSFERQLRVGDFHTLAVDIDDGNPSQIAVAAATRAAVGDAGFLLYSTRSSKPDARKWRVLLPLATPLTGVEYQDTQCALFDLLNDEGLTVDWTLSRTAQLVYLPNRGKAYTRRLYRGAALALGDDHPIAVRRAKRGLTKLAPSRTQRTTARIYEIDRFNQENPIEMLLPKYGYVWSGRGVDWRSPYQSGSSFATRAFGDYWVSLSWSDGRKGLGAPSGRGQRFGDAFDLYVHYEHGGDFSAALKTITARRALNTLTLTPQQIERARAAQSKPSLNEEQVARLRRRIPRKLGQ